MKKHWDLISLIFTNGTGSTAGGARRAGTCGPRTCGAGARSTGIRGAAAVVRILAAALVLTAALSGNAYAGVIITGGTSSSSSKRIDKVAINVDYTPITAGSTEDENCVKISLAEIESHYFVDDYYFVNLPSRYWRSGTIPKLSITLSSKEGYYFSSGATSLSNITVYCRSCDIYSAARNSESTLKITLLLDEVYGEDPDEDNDDFEGDEDGSESVSGPGVSSVASEGAWLKNSTGVWYCLPDRTFPANCWRKIQGKWYFFNASGYMQTGWIQWKNKWYYCGSDGVMYADRRTPDGYYVDSSGAWVEGK